MLAHGYGGSFHSYGLEEVEGAEGEGRWRPRPFTTGHFEEVSDLQWDADGRYLVSVSKDQTTRLWAPALATGAFHEMSRVQVHGYDLTSVDLIPGIENRLVSGADEKTLRVFDATNKVMSLLEDLCGIRSLTPARVETAYVPALGLTTKAVKLQVEGEDDVPQGALVGSGNGDKDDAQAIAKARVRVTWRGRGPPLEGELVDHTLWPEVHKLYGHGNGIVCLTTNHAGTLLASACKARDPETAGVRLWDTRTWRGVGVLPGHQSTVVQLAFSHDDSLLVSVSKDRQVCVYARQGGGEGGGAAEGGPPTYRLSQTLAKAHKRIVWSCSWSHDDRLLATGSRDGTARIWARTPATLELKDLAMIRPVSAAPGTTASVTAVAFSPRPRGLDAAGYVLAIGLESGDIEVWRGGDAAPWGCVLRFADGLAHAASVRRLRWRPRSPAGAGESDGGQEEEMVLASCGADHAVRIAAVRL